MNDFPPCPTADPGPGLGRDSPSEASYSSMQLQFSNGPTRQFFFRAKSSDEQVIKDIFCESKYGLDRIPRSDELAGFFHRQCATGRRPLVIDAGANIGASAVFFGANFPGSLVIAIEPDRDNYHLLAKNADSTSVEPLYAAVSSTPGYARIVDPGRGHWGYRTENIGAETTPDIVRRVTINDLYRQYCPTCFPFVVKVDIEGGEADLFSCNTEWVAKTPILIIELHDWMLLKSGNSRSFLSCVSRLDRDFLYRGEEVYSIANDL